MTMRRAGIVAALAALVVAAGAAAAGIAVTLNLQGGVGSRTLRACGVLHHYTLYRPGSRIEIDGKVAPAPAGYRVKLKVKQCVRGTFRTIWSGGVHERTDGTFTGVFLARRRGAFFARAYVHTGTRTFRSDKQHFDVR